jgi:predicted Zn finger-like uncharacterized protein
MDVRCERCQTEYELEDARISDLGTEVQCSDCGHLFTVKRDSARATRGDLSQAQPAEWTVETSLGQTHRLSDMAALHRWIIERRVGRQDRVSRDGQTWQHLGDIPELAPFFEIVDSAERARTADTPSPIRAGIGTPVLLQPMAIPSVAPEEVALEARGRPRALTPVLGQPAIPARTAVAPMGALPDAAETGETELVALARPKRRSYLKVLVTLFVAAVVAYAGILWQRHRWSSQGAQASVVDRQQAGAAPPADGTAGQSRDEATATGARDEEASVHGPVVEPLAGANDVHLLGKTGRHPGPGRPARREKPEAKPEAPSRHGPVTEARPGSPQSLAAQGYVALNRRLYPLAVALFKRAIQGDPDNATAIFGLAEAYRGSNQKPQALVIYKRYLQVAPGGPDSGIARAQIRLLEGHKGK